MAARGKWPATWTPQAAPGRIPLGHHQPEDFINDEWASLNQLAWLDARTTSGSWRIAQEFPNLPAWTCMYRGETMAGIVTDESRNDPERGFVGGYYLQLHSLGPSFLATFLSPRAWGRDFAKIMEQYDHMAGMFLVGEDMPRETNRVTLNRDVHDQFGQPVPNVHFDDHPNDTAMREHAYAAASRFTPPPTHCARSAFRRIRLPTTSEPPA